MKVSLVIITDGRNDYLRRMLASLRENVAQDWHRVVVVSDEPEAPLPTDDMPEPLTVIQHPRRMGGDAAVATAWRHVTRGPAPDFVFHMEDDWLFNGPVDLDHMATVLTENRGLAQLVLRRRSMEEESTWTPPGGWDGRWEPHLDYVAHRRNWSLNPCLYPVQIPRSFTYAGHETDFTPRLLDDGWRFAFYGAWDDPPHVTHIGEVRSRGARWGRA